MPATTEKTFTVKFSEDEFNEVCNLLQLMAVLGIRLYMDGNCHPKKALLMKAFDRMADVAMADPPTTPL